MSKASTELPDDIDALKALVEEQAAELANRERKIEQLEERIRLLLSRRYGSPSERVEGDLQLGLFNEAEEESEGLEAGEEECEVKVPAHTRRRRGRRPLPEYLPRGARSSTTCPRASGSVRMMGACSSASGRRAPSSSTLCRRRCGC